MSDLTAKEQKHVRTAIRFLRLRIGRLEPFARALRLEADTLTKVLSGRRGVTASLALRVARFAEVTVDDLLAGKYLPARTCPHCGHPPDDFVDEETVAE